MKDLRLLEYNGWIWVIILAVVAVVFGVLSAFAAADTLPCGFSEVRNLLIKYGEEQENGDFLLVWEEEEGGVVYRLMLIYTPKTMIGWAVGETKVEGKAVAYMYLVQENMFYRVNITTREATEISKDEACGVTQEFLEALKVPTSGTSL